MRRSTLAETPTSHPDALASTPVRLPTLQLATLEAELARAKQEKEEKKQEVRRRARAWKFVYF
jgi:hypothetical protein